VKDPGPNVLEQQIETNRLLALILAASGGPPAAGGSYPGLSGGGRCQWPTLFSWSNGQVHPFNTSGDDGYAVTVTSLEAELLSHDSAIKVVVPIGTGKKATMDIGLPMGPLEAPRLQFAFMTKHWPVQCYITAQLWYDNGTNILKSGIKLNENGHVFQYLNSAGVWTTIGTNIFDFFSKDWKKLDLAVNFAASKYSWAGCNADGYDLSAQALQTAVSSTKKRLTLSLEVVNNSSDTANEALFFYFMVTYEIYTGPPE